MNFKQILRFRNCAALFALSLFGLSLWLVWLHHQEKTIVGLENSVWFGDSRQVPEGIEPLQGFHFSLLTPGLQARRQGLLGDLSLANSQYEKAKSHYLSEFIFHYGALKHPDQFQTVFAEAMAAGDKVSIPTPPPFDTSLLTDRIALRSISDNAYYELSKIPKFRNLKIIKSGSYLFSKQHVENARIFAEINREIIEQWEIVSNKYDLMWHPVGIDEYIRLDLLAKVQYCQLQVALNDGDDIYTMNRLKQLFQTIELMASEGCLIYSLVTIRTKRELIESLSELEFPESLRNSVAEVVEQYPTTEIILSLVAAREFHIFSKSIVEGDGFDDLAEGFKGGNQRLIYEVNKALYLHWLEADMYLMGEREGSMPERQPKRIPLEEYRIARRGFYWNESHSRLANHKEGQRLIAEGGIKCAAKFFANISAANAVRFRDEIAKVASAEQVLIQRLRKSASNLSVFH